MIEQRWTILAIFCTHMVDFCRPSHIWFGHKICCFYHYFPSYRVVGKFGRESLANWLFSTIWQKKIWRINRSANRLLNVSTNFDGFSFANHGRFAKFIKLPPAKLFRYTVTQTAIQLTLLPLFTYICLTYVLDQRILGGTLPVLL